MIGLRALGWLLFAGAAAGFAHDEIVAAKTRFADLAGGLLAVVSAVHSGTASALSDLATGALSVIGLYPAVVAIFSLPAFPIAMVAGIAILWLSSSQADGIRPIDLVARAKQKNNGIAASQPFLVKPPPRTQVEPGTELRTALFSVRNAFIGVAVFSGFINILMLTGSFFMLEVYDRVLPSRSVPTLVGLSLLALLLFLIQGGIDLVRTRILTRIGSVIDESVSGRVHEALVQLPLRSKVRSDGLQPLRDLDAIRGFLSGLGPTALFDMPWVPLYIGVIYLFHPMLGLVALAGALLLVALTLVTEVLTSRSARKSGELAAQQLGLADASRRNAEVLAAMGMGGVMQDKWQNLHRGYVNAQRDTSDVALGFGAFSKVFRMMLQSGVLALGAYLVVHGEASAGIIIAGSILVSRALAPIELAIANWRGFVGARQGWLRTNQLLKQLPAAQAPMSLPIPSKTLSVEALFGAAPGEARPVIENVSFSLNAGDGLAIMGPSASGKSTLVRLLVGVWRGRGSVRLDGAALEQWSNDDLGRFIGYLPQDVELFSGTVAENIARFDPNPKAEAIVAAAMAAGAHDLIVGLPSGYETQIGESGKGLSGGQQQRVALARALYGDPFLIVLDEPNSNLDADGESALTQAIVSARKRGAIVIVVAHRPSALAGLGHVLAIFKGRVQAFGPKEEVLPKILRPMPAGGAVAVPGTGGGGAGAGGAGGAGAGGAAGQRLPHVVKR